MFDEEINYDGLTPHEVMQLWVISEQDRKAVQALNSAHSIGSLAPLRFPRFVEVKL